MSAIPQDTTVHHKKTVKHFVPTGKSFQKAGKGYFDKYVVEFTDGYIAEALSPRGQLLQGFESGKEIWFRIGYRGTHGDEIEAVSAPAPDQSTNGNTAAPRIVNVNGHPAVVALGMAKEMRVARIAALNPISPNDFEREEAFGMAGLLENADTILEWLIEKVRPSES